MEKSKALNRLKVMDKEAFELNLEEFKEWLELDTHQGNYVGRAGNATECPIAKYISYKKYFPEADREFEVVDDEVLLFCGDLVEPINYPLPDWAIDFITVIDRKVGDSVSAKYALDALSFLGDINIGNL